VSFVDGITTELVGCSDQQLVVQTNTISVLGGRRGAEWDW